MKAQVAIVDCGGANIASLLYALERIGARPTVTNDATVIRTSDRVILPGVGAAKNAMQQLRRHGLIDTIRGLTQPVLGICLGMQLLAEGSEEENVECLGIIPGIAMKLAAEANHPVPNMGWCRTRLLAGCPLLSRIDDGACFYFVHSYALPVASHTIATAQHRAPFTAIARHKNFVATQFHPERSSSAGSTLLHNFLKLSA